MKKEAILKACEDVFFSFDALRNIHDSDQFADCRLTVFIQAFVPFPEDDADREGWENLVKIGFGLGFVIGQSVDLESPALLKLREIVKKEKLLPYFPREKKAA